VRGGKTLRMYLTFFISTADGNAVPMVNGLHTLTSFGYCLALLYLSISRVYRLR
jgi:hypothetical protein